MRTERIHSCPLFRLWFLSLMLFVNPARAGVETTVHNLRASGAMKGTADGGPITEVCYFCHVPHNSRPARGLWEKELSPVTYKLYESPTLSTTVSQPTGSSRLCLSCHDGTVAMANFNTKPDMDHLSRRPMKGKASLGTDLSDDHPISFLYDAALALRNGKLADPSSLPSTVRMDNTGQLQCTTCHDPHEDQLPKFQVMTNERSRLCLACHRIDGWASSSHAASSATWSGVGIDPWRGSELKTVTENGCGNCHRVHSAGRPQWLLNFADEEMNCFSCHSGNVASKDVESEFRKFSSHPIQQTEWSHTPGEDLRQGDRHVTCSDCHNPHSSESGKSVQYSLPNSLRGALGLNVSGAIISSATFEYEVCYRCHGVNEQNNSRLVRQDHVTNVRLEFDPGNRSFHPVVSAGKNPEISSLEAGYTPSSVIRCSDCHNGNDAASQTGVKGPHGSIYEPILEREYQTEGPLAESLQSYSLCYKCHNRTGLLSDQGGFPHRLHVVEKGATCATCHDAHGSRNNTNLVNFLMRGKSGDTVVTPSSTGLLEFRDLGESSGECYLSCHGTDHNPKRYQP